MSRFRNIRLTTLPVDNDFKELRECYEDQRGCFWVPNAIDMEEDERQWPRIEESKRRVIEFVLAFFAASDTIVNVNIGENLLPMLDRRNCLEGQYAYRYQLAMEDIHAEMYSSMLDKLIKDDGERERLLNAVENIPTVGRKADWCAKFMKDSTTEEFAECLIAFICVEGIFFSSAFAIIFWIKEQNLLPGLCESNEYISRDEGLHCKFGCKLYQNKKLGFNVLSVERIHDIIREAVQIETEFVHEAIPSHLTGMNAELMIEHVEHVADQICTLLNIPVIFKRATTPFKFMLSMNLDVKTDFFAHRVSQYKREVTAVKLYDENVLF